MAKDRFAVNIMFFINGFLYASWVSRLPRFQENYHMDNSTTGLVLLAASIGALIAMPYTGWLIIKNGSRKVTALAAIGFCCAIPLTTLFSEVWLLGAMFFIMGAFTGTKDVAMNAQAVLVETRKGRPIMSSFHAVFSGGMMLGAGAGALFTRFGIGLSTHIFTVSGLCLLLVLWGNRHLINDKPEKKPSSDGKAFQIPSRSLLGMGIIAFCCMLGEGAMADWSTNFMEKVAHSGKATAPLGLAAFSSAMMIGRIVGDRARTVLGDRLLLTGNSLIATLGLSLVLLFPYPTISILGLFLVGLGLSVIVPIAYSTAGKTNEVSPGVGIAMVTTIGYSGFLFGPPIIGFLADWQNLRSALTFVLFLFFFMTFIALRQNPPGNPSTD